MPVGVINGSLCTQKHPGTINVSSLMWLLGVTEALHVSKAEPGSASIREDLCYIRQHCMMLQRHSSDLLLCCTSSLLNG